jgi:predicted ATP-grasp superfamily ATP-dependent carboligase
VPDPLYRVTEPLPDLGRPVLIQALTGFVDAGSAAKLAREHILSSLPNEVLATFDIDALLDYRSRRPPMIFVEDHWESYDEPSLVLHLVRDTSNVPFLLLSGPEPDLLWERFVGAVIELMDRLNVRLSVGFNAIPMAVPHTRPTGITAHATRRELIAGHEPWLHRVQVPGGAGHLLEFRLGQRGRDAVGFAVHVPHYLAQSEYPAAAERLLTAVSKATGLLLPAEELRVAAGLARAEIDKQIAQADEAASVVRGLEQQYDEFIRGQAGTNLLGSRTDRCPADEQAADCALSRQQRPNDPPRADPRSPHWPPRLGPMIRERRGVRRCASWQVGTAIAAQGAICSRQPGCRR